MKKYSALIIIILCVLLLSCRDSYEVVNVSTENSGTTPETDKTSFGKMISQSQPGDGAILTGEELIITWTAAVDQADKVIVRFRQDGVAKWQELDAKEGSIKIDDIDIAEDYQYQLVAELGSKKIEAPVCTVTFQKGPGFADHEPAFSISRDYQVRRSVEVINPTDSKQQIILNVESSSDDLIVGFVGSGSADSFLEIPAGATVPVSMVFFAQDANPGEHSCVIRMQVPSSQITDNATAMITVEKPNFSLGISTNSVDPLTLATEIRVVNHGDMLTDFDIVPIGVNANRVRCIPRVEHAKLAAGDAIACKIQPILRLGEREFTCDIEFRAANQSIRKTVSFKVPEDKQVFAALSHSTIFSRLTGWFCTNKPDFNSDMEGYGNGVYYDYEEAAFYEKYFPDIEKSHYYYYKDNPSGLQRVLRKLKKLISKPAHGKSATSGVRASTIRPMVAKEYPDLEKNNLHAAHSLNGISGASIVWHHMNKDSSQDVSFAAMSSKGETNGPVNISTAMGNSRWPTIGGSLNGTMLVAWEDDRDGKKMEIYLSRSTDEGRSWTKPERLTEHGSGAYDPILWTQDKSWLVIWEDGRGGIYTRRSDDDGINWQPEVRVSGGNAAWPVLSGKKDKIWCIWEDGTAVKIANSSDIGDTWSEAVQLSENDGKAGEPTIATAGNEVFTAWRSEEDGISDIIFRSFVEGSWNRAINVTDDPVMCEYPSLAVNDSELSLGYISSSLGHASGYSRLSFDKGKTWEPARRETRLNPNLTQAFLVVNFDLPWDRSAYRKHNVEIFVNDHQVAELTDVIPEGKYIFPVNPYTLNYVPGGVSKNNIHFSTKHMNGGHYVVTADFKIIHFLTHQERNVIATSQEEADRLLQAKSDDHINHDRPDAAVYANLISGLPDNTDEKQTLDLEIEVSNVGPVPLRGGQLECTMITEDGDIPLCDPASFGEIAPGRRLPVPIKFEHDGSPKRVAIRVVADGPDADLTNDVRILRLGMLDNGFLIVDSDNESNYKLISPLTGFEVAKVNSGEKIKLPIGVYDLIGADGKRVLPNISIRGGETTQVDPGNTGIVEVKAYKNVDLTFISDTGDEIKGSSNKDLRLPTGFYSIEAKDMIIPDIVIRRGKHITVEAIAKGKIYVDYIQHGDDVVVYDIHGNKVSGGWTNGVAGGIRPLPPGTYTVSTGEASMDNVPVRSGETTKIRLSGVGVLNVLFELDGKPAGKNTQYKVYKKKGERITLNFIGSEVYLPIGNSYTVTCLENTWENVEIKDDQLTKLQVQGIGRLRVWPENHNYFYKVYDLNDKELTSFYTNYPVFLKSGTYKVVVSKYGWSEVLESTRVSIKENKTTIVKRK